MRDAKADWDARISIRSDEQREFAFPDLDPPKEVRAVGGIGQVTIDWSPVEGAVGYLVLRATEDGPLEPVDHHSGDILAVAGPPYVDTTGTPGTAYRYAVASVPEVTAAGRASEMVGAVPLVADGIDPVVTVTVDAVAEGIELQRPWVPMVGSERLSQLLCKDLSGGREIGMELEQALRRMHDELGVRTVRAHAIFHDDTRVFGETGYDFTVVDAIYDKLLEIGLRPVVELGFMPRELAADPSRTVFEYGAIISPPRSYEAWGDLVRALVEHLVLRYGLDEVVNWDFEVWNEANLAVFWSGTKAEWMRLYDVTTAAVKAVDQRLKVGGPSSAAAGWVDDLLAHAAANGSPVDFVSTHLYGSAPLDVRASLERHGFGDARILWTEWGVTPTHFNPINDSVFAGVFVLRGMRSAAGRVDALSYWVASDHFEELGRPPRLLHGGFGLQTVGGLPKPRFHALSLLHRLGPVELPVQLTGDGAGSLVEAWASRDRDRIAVLLWNLTLDQTKYEGAPELTRTIRLELPDINPTWQPTATYLTPGAPGGTGAGGAPAAGGAGAEGALRPADTAATQGGAGAPKSGDPVATEAAAGRALGSGDLVAVVRGMGIGDWPGEEEWEELRRRSGMVSEGLEWDGVGLAVRVPMPGAVLVELQPPRG